MLTLRPIATELPGLLEQAAQFAPYLARLINRDAEPLGLTGIDALKDHFDPWLQGHADLLAAIGDMDTAMAALRNLKREGHLLVALQDLAGAIAQPQVTEHLSAIADLSVQTALRVACLARGLASEGLFILALGKHGARELNYSSDIDLIAVYDLDRFDGGERDAGDAACRIVRDAISLLETQTGDGYVFRTDFRLRPDPASTPVAISTRFADTYYESVGQNWERMVFIKARCCAGDADAAADFLAGLSPFIWRRHLDYWAIADIHAIKRMINAKVGDPSLGDIASDLKLGPGGIREIEFFAQTQQVILGGRDPALRAPTTCGALVRLADAGVIEWEACTALTEAYHALRAVEHRVQMLNDAQTHTLPRDEAGRDRVAALCGYENRLEFETALLAVRQTVHDHYQDLFAEEERQAEAAIAGNLVFTGIDPDPGTLQTLANLGFGAPERVIETVQRWHRGHVPATRTARGRQILTAMLPAMLKAMSDTGEPDTAFSRFSTFFEGLSSGVQVLSMLLAEPALLEDLVSTFALAPRLAQTLARKPACLEALIDGGFAEQLVIPEGAGFEVAMDEARRFHREQSLLIGHSLLHGRLRAADAGIAWSQLADATLQSMNAAAAAETARRFGPAPGQWAVFAMGKLGGMELTAGSDLDLLILYRADPGAADAQTWFTRFTQRYITALSAPTGEGLLYEIDMRLRPSGRAGPVAVSLDAFQRYHVDEAWTWEHMALTRLRPVAGHGDLFPAVVESAREAIVSRAGNGAQILQDAADMRARMRAQKPASGVWDMKLASGGMVDIEFITQAAILTAGDASLITGTTDVALERLGWHGLMEAETVSTLRDALGFQHALQQVFRVAIGDARPDVTLSTGLANRLSRAVGEPDISTVLARLAELRAGVADIFLQKLPPAATK